MWLYFDETNKRKQAKPSALASGASFRRFGVGCFTSPSSESELELRSRPLVGSKCPHLPVTPADCRCGSWIRCSADLRKPSCPMISCLRPLGSIAISLASSVSLSHCKSLSLLSLSLSLSFLCMRSPILRHKIPSPTYIYLLRNPSINLSNTYLSTI